MLIALLESCQLEKFQFLEDIRPIAFEQTGFLIQL